MLKHIILLYFSVCFCKAFDDKTNYTTKFDNVNLDEILASDRLLKNYVNCLLEKGPCTPDGTELKNNLPDAIVNDCAKCSEKQKIGSEIVMHHIIDNKPDWWEDLEKMYNPDGSYKKQYLLSKEKFAEEADLVIHEDNSKKDHLNGNTTGINNKN